MQSKLMGRKAEKERRKIEQEILWPTDISVSEHTLNWYSLSQHF